MAKYKRRQTVYTSTKGPIKMAIDASEDMLSLFTTKARNDIVRDAMWQGGEYWRLTELPKRFTKYAFKLGYQQHSAEYKRKKEARGNPLPLVWDGDLRDMATTQSSTTARATKNKTEAVIRIPGPPYMNQQPMVYKILRSVPPWEIKRVAEVVTDALASNLEIAAPTVRSDNKKQGLGGYAQATFARSKKKNSRASGKSQSRRP